MRSTGIQLPTERLRRNARDWIAAAVAAAAVFAVPGTAIGLTTGGLHGWSAASGVLVFAVGLAALLYSGRRRSISPAENLTVAFVGAALAWLVGLGGFILLYGAGLCGGGRVATSVSWIALFGVYFVVGSWAMLGRVRPLWGLPLAVALAVAAHYGALALIPGGRGYCET